MSKENEVVIKSNEYMYWADTAKGIGVFLVIIGHLWYCSNLPGINVVIYSFHMPMFFILSGFLTKKHAKGNLAEFVYKKFKRLVVPAALCVLIGIPYYIFVVGKTLEFEVFLRHFFFTEGLALYNAPCWFFFTMFQVVVIERIFNIIGKSIVPKLLICVGLFLVGMGMYTYDTDFYFGMDKMIIALGFFIIGNVIREVYDRYKDNLENMMVYYGVLIALIIPWFVFGVILNPKITMYRMHLGFYPYFVLAGVLGSICFFLICMKIRRKLKYVNMISDNTIFIVGTHFMLVDLFERVMISFGLEYTWAYSVLAVSYAVILVVVYLFVCKFVNSKLPFLNGRELKTK